MEALTVSFIAKLAFQKFLEVGAGDLGKKFTQEALRKMEQLRKLIWNKLKGNQKSQEALTKVEQGSKADLDRVISYLQVAMDDDDKFAQQVQTLAIEIKAGKVQDNSSMRQINQNNAKGWQTKVEGGTAYIGEEISIQNSASQSGEK